ncbi:junctional adhesion molecule-like [Eptesicus fuscus]|uniref:junctional adhesion molecule-like n=1 Tax=Eptesicus fuscus TaxID=29078 RepID=UPI002403E783|nr:junctional adhesion molecule-like [Eptesicus fuscus]XP_054581567.1 junctional adhesion molecule-like [Eptesicus fuscus]XP_054581568.1 junctional adhesion molecule-like [Eptesicus fuscus]
MESSVLCLLTLALRPVLLGCFLGLNDLLVSSLELTVHAGEPALLGCVFQSVEGKRVTKVDWTFSPREDAKVDYVLYYYSNLSVPVGRFLHRARLAGGLAHNDGSLLLQDVQEADQGTYTCEIRLELESRVFKTQVALHVLPAEPRELMVHVGDSASMGCAFQSTEEKLMTKVEWTFSPEKHAKEEVVLHYSAKRRGPAGYSPSGGRFRNRLTLAGDTAHNDGSVLLQGVRESDTGSYTCSIQLGDLTFRKTFVLHVIQREPQTLVTAVARTPEVLGGTQLVIIVGIVCATVLLLPVLILTARRIQGSKSSGTSKAPVKRLEDRDRARPEKHIYSSLTVRGVTKEEPSERPEATYMTMRPVWPSAPSNPPEKKWAEGGPRTGQAF